MNFIFIRTKKTCIISCVLIHNVYKKSDTVFASMRQHRSHNDKLRNLAHWQISHFFNFQTVFKTIYKH